jgi:REP element-mobilizing transposase RayT
MSYDPQKHNRRSIRLKGYDYTQPGAYFVTIVAWGRECLFGKVVDGEMRLSAAGRIVEAEWWRLGRQFPNIRLDAFVVTPNHVHAIIVIHENANTVGSPRPTQIDPSSRTEGSAVFIDAGATLDDERAAASGRSMEQKDAMKGRSGSPVQEGEASTDRPNARSTRIKRWFLPPGAGALNRASALTTTATSILNSLGGS